MLDAGVCLDRCAFCTDDKHVEEIRKEGHISTCIRKAIALGVPVAKAYKMGSYQAAEFYGLKNYGAIGAGYRADIVFLDDLEQVRPLDVMKDGRILTEEDYAKDYSVPVPILLEMKSSKSFWIASQSSMNTFWSMEGMCRQYPKDIRRHCFATVILSSADAEMSERKNFIC